MSQNVQHVRSHSIRSKIGCVNLNRLLGASGCVEALIRAFAQRTREYLIEGLG